MAKKVRKYIDSDRATEILRALDDVCIWACEELGKDIGFTINTREFKIHPQPDLITSIVFDFQLTLTKEQ